jgi:hypothetical protein
MKNLFFLLLCFVFFIQIGCDKKQKNEKSKDIIGIWQNTSQPNSAVEFTENGDYYVRIDSKRLMIFDSIKDKYIYDLSLGERNLKIFRISKNDTSIGKLLVINPDRIKISLIHSDTVVSESEFTKLKE